MQKKCREIWTFAKQRQIRRHTISLAAPGVAVGDPGAKVGGVERERRVGGGGRQRAADAGQSPWDHGQLLPDLPLQHAVQRLHRHQPHPVITCRVVLQICAIRDYLIFHSWLFTCTLTEFEDRQQNAFLRHQLCRREPCEAVGRLEGQYCTLYFQPF